ncbi:MAG: hypothetical protein H6832_05200 [Planctomycetes bacterium]|nr:hypothetical protein [Planctomycetota bacterium]
MPKPTIPSSTLRRVRGAAVLTACLTSAVAAQGSVPGFSRAPQPSWILVNSFNSVPGNDIQQVFHQKLSNNKDGQWTTCLSVAGLPAYFGGDGSSTGIVMGTFAPYPQDSWFVASTEAKALNSSADERNLTIDPSGLWAIFDRPATGVFVATRAKVGDPFGSPVQVSGFGSLRDVMPALAPHGGKMQCFYTDRARILMHEIDLTIAAPKLVGQPVVVSLPVQAGAKPLRPTPLLGGDGDAEGLFLSEEVAPHTVTGTGDADPCWAADLDPATPALILMQRPDWQPGGAPAGGFLYFGHDILPRFHVMHSECAWMVGDDEPLGGTADLRVVGYNPNKLLASIILVATKTATGIKVNDYAGLLGLDLASLVVLPPMPHTTLDGDAVMSFRVPNDSNLRGTLALQSLVVDIKTGAATFSNTASLILR